MTYKPRGRFRKKEIARINQSIIAPEVRVVASDGEALGIMNTKEAYELAKEEGLDLVEVAPKAKPPVARITDYGKYRYEHEQKIKKARKKQHNIEVKEIKFRPKIGQGDYETKKRHVERFLKAGAKVKVTIMFRGREMTHPELGRKILDRLSEDVAEHSVIDSPPKRDGRNMIMVLGSTIKPNSKEEEEEEKRKESKKETKKDNKEVDKPKESKEEKESKDNKKEEEKKKSKEEVKTKNNEEALKPEDKKEKSKPKDSQEDKSKDLRKEDAKKEDA
ncbi:hypothetical protein LCGC14_0760240 [marine sediment metagenome]|uniref:Translation initiation factor IF-3 n=1 Tax=marine sediment metagenome TaxID=412755 RepID=A0A0F9SLM8_9ZZZZ